jgi:hypothetical protein
VADGQWPEFAFWTASIASLRILFTQSWSMLNSFMISP